MTKLLDQTILLHPEQSKTNVSIPLDLTRDYESLEIICSYSPKIVQEELAITAIKENLPRYIPESLMETYGDPKRYLPLVNLITFSLQWNDQYIGCAHRHAPKHTFVFSKNEQPKGFSSFIPKAGQYQFTLNVHSVTSEEVSYHMIVNAYTRSAKNDTV